MILSVLPMHCTTWCKDKSFVHEALISGLIEVMRDYHIM